MKIDPKNNIDNIYQSNSASRKNISKKNDTLKEKGFEKDKVEISNAGSKHDEVASAKEKIIYEVEKGVDVERLRQLKADIENGNYRVSSEDIASAIMRFSKKDE